MMNAAVHPVVGKTATISTLDHIKIRAVNAVNYLGRVFEAIGTSIKYYAVKAVEVVKPFFTKAAKFFVETYDKTREFVVANKEVVSASAISLFVGGLIVLTFHLLLNGTSDSIPVKPVPTPATPA